MEDRVLLCFWDRNLEGLLPLKSGSLYVCDVTYEHKSVLSDYSSLLTYQGMNGAVRDETLLRVTVPVMFVQGSKDGLCPLEKLEAVRKKMKAKSGLHEIDGGDHSFKISKKHLETKGSTQDEAEDAAVQAIASFFSKVLEGM